MPQAHVQTGDRELPVGPVHPIAVVLDHLRSAHNVGNIFRLADLCRIAHVHTCGYTPAPPHPKLVKTARGCDTLVPSTHHATCRDALLALRQQGYTCVAVETVPAAPELWDAAWPSPVAFVFGNEALGISADALPLCELTIRLPVYGHKNSLNVGNCAAVVLYEAVHRLRQA